MIFLNIFQNLTSKDLFDLFYVKNQNKQSAQLKSPLWIATDLYHRLQTILHPQKINSCSTPIAQRKVEAPGPELDINRINMLQELKAKFAQGNKIEQEKVEQKLSKVTSLNDIRDELTKTASGAYLIENFGGDKDLEKAMGHCIDTLLHNILRDEKSPHRIVSDELIQNIKQDYQGFKHKVMDQCRTTLINSVAYDPEKYHVFYHGHGNSLRLYLDMLGMVKEYENLRSADQENPLRDKNMKSEGNTVSEILENYESEALKYAQDNNLKLFDNDRLLGVGFAPDKIPYMRDNVISANINLFGNVNLLAECTLFYYLDSFNISNPDKGLIDKLLKRILPQDISEEERQARIQKYTDLYTRYMEETGGNLMQIFIPKEDVDDLVFPSWMKGVPIFVDKNHGKLKTRGGNWRAAQILTPDEKKTAIPAKASDYLDTYIHDQKKFVTDYADLRRYPKITPKIKLNCLDRPQVRIVVDQDRFNSGDIKVKQYTKNTASQDALNSYKTELHKLIQEDMQKYISSERLAKNDATRLGKLATLIREGNV